MTLNLLIFLLNYGLLLAFTSVAIKVVITNYTHHLQLSGQKLKYHV